jgi:DNA-binding MarR family transcriptional regulator
MPPSEDLVIALYRLGLVQRRLTRDALADLGSQGFTALALIHRHGPARVSELAEHMSVTLPVASRQVGALVRAGYVERESDPEDGRAQRLRATEAGARVLGESRARMVDSAAIALSGWSEAEVAALAEQLERLREDFAAVAETGARP